MALCVLERFLQVAEKEALTDDTGQRFIQRLREGIAPLAGPEYEHRQDDGEGKRRYAQDRRPIFFRYSPQALERLPLPVTDIQWRMGVKVSPPASIPYSITAACDQLNKHINGKGREHDVPALFL